MSRKVIIAGNWKMNKTAAEGKALVEELKKLVADVPAAKADIGFEELRVDDDVAKVSVIGVGMRSHAGVAQTMFRALADKGVKFQAISTSEIKTSVVIDEKYLELAVRSLHTAFGLDKSE